MCVGNCGMDLGLALGAACPSGMGHLGYMVCLPGLGCLRVVLVWRRLGFGLLCHCESLGIWSSHCKWEPAADCDWNTLKGEECGVCGCGVVAESVLGLINDVCASAY